MQKFRAVSSGFGHFPARPLRRGLPGPTPKSAFGAYRKRFSWGGVRGRGSSPRGGAGRCLKPLESRNWCKLLAALLHACC
eukprot:11861431-Alexandrium_andersonii.AAC.1